MRKRAKASMYLQLIAALAIAIGIVAYASNHTGGTAWAQAERKQAQTAVIGIEGPEEEQKYAQEQAEKEKKLANLEAMLNIVANGTEIAFIASVGFYLIGAVICFIRKRFFMGTVLIGLCPLVAIIGLATPDTINWVVASARHGKLDLFTVGTAMAVVGGLLTVINAVFALFLPAMIAFKEQHPKKWIIFGLCFIAWFIPFGWIGLMVWALWYIPVSSKELGNTKSSIDFSRPWDK